MDSYKRKIAAAYRDLAKRGFGQNLAIFHLRMAAEGALKLEPDNREIMASLAEALYLQGKEVEAVKYGKVIISDPASPSWCKQLAQFILDLSSLQEIYRKRGKEAADSMILNLLETAPLWLQERELALRHRRYFDAIQAQILATTSPTIIDTAKAEVDVQTPTPAAKAETTTEQTIQPPLITPNEPEFASYPPDSNNDKPDLAAYELALSIPLPDDADDGL